MKLELSRGGQPVTANVAVGDLHAITPAAYLDFGESIVHSLSHQQARHFNLPVRGAYVANPGYLLGAAGIPRGAVVLSVDGKPIGGLDDFEAAIGPRSATATARRCASRPSTTRTAASCARCGWTGAGSRRAPLRRNDASGT